MKSFSLIIGLLLSFAYTNAQEKIVTGTVTGNGLPIPSVNILVKNSVNKGAVTDFDGNYSIEVSPSDVLVFSYVGYLTQEIPVGEKTEINVKLEEDLNQLDEIVLIGYGAVKKKDLTGAVSTVEGTELEKRTVTSIQETLSGQLPGVQVSSSGAPGSEAQVTVRGFSTLNNNSPLFVVDDVPLDDIGFISPNDVESVQVLKDASATAIYGSRASNGVIIIKTKQGKANKLTVNIDSYSSFQRTSNRPDLSSGTEYARTINRGRLNDGNTALYDNPENFGAGTDWFDVVTQDALLNNIAINVNGGSEKIKVSSGLSYQTQDGLEKGSDFERITARLNSEFKIMDNLTLTQSFSLGQSFTTNGPGLIFDALRLEPITSPYLPAYEQPAALNEFSIFSPTITDVPNALGRLARNFNEVNNLRGVGTLAINWEIVEGLTAKSQFSAYFSSYEQNVFTPNFFIEPDDQQILNSVERTSNNRMNTVWNNILSYNKKIKNHDFGLMGGIIFEGREHRTLYGRGLNTPSNDPDLRFLEAATEGFFTSGNNENYNLISYLGRLNYSFKSKYLLTATFRADGSSLFPDDNKWGFFPSISGAWVISDEDFINNDGLLSYLKLRGGWGQIGNDNRNSLPQNARLTTIINDFTTVGSEQNLYVAAVPGNVGNADLQWETVEDINIGIDAKFFQSRLGINLDVYRRKTFDMLMPQSIPAYLGSGFDAQWANVGNFENRGFDLGINFKADIGEVKSNFTLNVSHYEAKATKLADGEAVLDGNDQRLDLLARTEEGRAPGLFFGFVTDGIFQNQTEINSHSDQFGNIIQPNAQPGDFRFRDLNGDGELTNEDRKFIGDPTPDFTFGFKMAFEYKNFDFNALFSGSYGNDALNVARAYIGNGGEFYNSYAGVLANSWNGEGTSNSEPRISIDDPNGNFRYSDYYVEDGSFLRFQNFQLGYSFTEDFLKKAGLSRARVYLSGENIFTLTSFSGLEVDLGGSATLRGVEYGSYPIPQTFSIGVNLSL